MRLTDDLRDEVTRFTDLMRAVPALRARIILDPVEGWPCVPGRYGRLEWRGASDTSTPPRVYAYTDRSRILSRLREVPGARPCQRGDNEGAVSLLATDHAAILTCARLLRCQTNGRGGGPGRSAEALAAIRPGKAVPA